MCVGANAKQIARAHEIRLVSWLFVSVSALCFVSNCFSMSHALNFETDNAMRTSQLLVLSEEVMCLSVCLCPTCLRVILDLSFSACSAVLFLFLHCFTLIISPAEQFGIMTHRPGLLG